MSRLPLLIPLVSAMLASLLAGCGGGDGTTADTSSPVVSSAQAGTEPVVKQSRITVTGSVVDDTAVQSLQLSLNGQTSTVTVSSGSFTATVDLKAGRNAWTLTAQDAAGNRGTAQGSVYLGHRVAGGNAHSGALVNGQLYTWGRNNYGQSGLGFVSTPTTTTNTHPIAPTRVTATPTFVSLAFNGLYSLAIDSTGQVWSWGDDTYGELGRGDQGRSNCGTSGTNNCRLDIGAVPGLNTAIYVAAGYDHALTLKADGTVWAMGWNSRGQLGNGTNTNSAVPVQVQWSADDAQTVGRIIQIAAGSQSSFALDDKGQVWAWGSNQYGNTGRGTTAATAQSTPLLVPMPAGVRITSIASGRDHVLALNSDGSVYAWGLNASSQVGYRTLVDTTAGTAWATPVTSPTLLPWTSTHPVVEVYGNGNTSYARDAAGMVYQWGLYGVSSGTSTTYPNLSAPTRIQDAMTGIIDLSMGQLHEVALRQDGTVFSWGWSFEGSLGGGSTAINTWMYNTPLIPVFP